MSSAAGVPPGSRVKCVGGCESAKSGLMARTRVDLPEKSGPSIVTKMPLGMPVCAAGLSGLRRGPAQGVTLRRGDVGLEEALLLRSRTTHCLRVPLDTEQPLLGEVP